jgi:two-component system cell cycle response regulator DivK
LELTRRLKADSRKSASTVVALTAYAMKGDRARILAAGCDGYISKPIDADSFVDTVTRYLPAAA